MSICQRRNKQISFLTSFNKSWETSLDKDLKFQGHPAVAQHHVLSGVEVEEETWNEHTIASSTWPKDC